MTLGKSIMHAERNEMRRALKWEREDGKRDEG